MSERVEVPVSEAREGDWAVLKGDEWPDEVTARIYRIRGTLLAAGNIVRFQDGRPSGLLVCVLRDVPALPTTPGTVIIATIRGEKNVQAMLCDDGDWASDRRVGYGAHSWHESEEIDPASVRVVYEPETH